MSDKHIGSSLDDFLQEEGLFEETQAQAIKEVTAWHRSGDEGQRDFQGADGYAAQNQPDAGKPPARS